MKYFKLTIFILVIFIFGCNKSETKTNSFIEGKFSTSKGENEKNITNDKEQIQNLISNVLNWSDSKNSIDLLPIIKSNNDSIYVGFDLNKHKQNLDQLKATDLFSEKFIKNYNQIILTLDKGIRNGSYGEWLVGDLPTFAFANDVNPWTLYQDIPYAKPNPYDHIEINLINLKNGEIEWKWGKLDKNSDTDWKEFRYRFRVVKEEDKWKIDYLEGFDFEKCT